MRNLFLKSRKFAWISFAEARTFSRFFQRALGDLHFSTLSTNSKCNQRKSWRVNFHDHHRFPSRSYNETKLQTLWNNGNNSLRLGAGGRHGRRHGNVKGRCTCEIINFKEAQKGTKKSYLKGYLSAIKRLMLKTEVKENQYLSASGIKFFQKQTAGNNCPVCITDRLNVRLGATYRIWENFFSILECHFFFLWSCKSSNRILYGSGQLEFSSNSYFLTLLDYANEI